MKKLLSVLALVLALSLALVGGVSLADEVVEEQEIIEAPVQEEVVEEVVEVAEIAEPEEAVEIESADAALLTSNEGTQVGDHAFDITRDKTKVVTYPSAKNATGLIRFLCTVHTDGQDYSPDLNKEEFREFVIDPTDHVWPWEGTTVKQTVVDAATIDTVNKTIKVGDITYKYTSYTPSVCATESNGSITIVCAHDPAKTLDFKGDYTYHFIGWEGECGETKTYVIEYEHKLGSKQDPKQYQDVKVPTCTENGIVRDYCLNEGCEWVGPEIQTDKLAHEYEFVWTVNVTCVSDGQKANVCKNCQAVEEGSTKTYRYFADDEKVYELKADGTKNLEVEAKTIKQVSDEEGGDVHKFGTWHFDPEPTCTEAGVHIRACILCNIAKETEDLERYGHDYANLVATVVEDSNCTEPGEIKYTCPVCKEVVTRDVEIADYVELKKYYVNGVAMSQTAAEEKADKDHPRTIPAVAGKHPLEYVKKTDSEEPGCVIDGYNQYTCYLCGEIWYETVPAKGHTTKTVTLAGICDIDDKIVTPTITVVYCTNDGCDAAKLYTAITTPADTTKEVSKEYLKARQDAVKALNEAYEKAIADTTVDPVGTYSVTSIIDEYKDLKVGSATPNKDSQIFKDYAADPTKVTLVSVTEEGNPEHDWTDWTLRFAYEEYENGEIASPAYWIRQCKICGRHGERIINGLGNPDEYDDKQAAKAIAEDAIAEIEKLAGDEDERSEDLQNLVDEAEKAINDAKNVEEVEEAYAKYYKEIEDLLAKEAEDRKAAEEQAAAEALAAAKEAAIDAINDAAGDDLSDDMQAIVDEAIAAIEDAEDIDTVEELLADALAAIAAQDDAEDPVKLFVARNYDLILGRDVDATGLIYWADQLKDKTLTGAGLVNGIVISDEFAAKNMSAEDFVSTLYEAVMGREADETGLAYWTGLMETGVSESYVVNGFATSAEFAKICAEYGIEAGKVDLTQSRDKNLNVTEFVSRNYTKALNRSGDAEGINYWCNKLLNKNMTAQQVAYGFVFSDESVKRNLSDSAFVDMLYGLYMGRTADTTGKTYWVNSLSNGMTRQQVANQFAASPEFTAIVASYGL